MVKALMAVPAMPKAMLTMTSLVVMLLGWEEGATRCKVELGNMVRLRLSGFTVALSDARLRYPQIVSEVERSD